MNPKQLLFVLLLLSSSLAIAQLPNPHVLGERGEISSAILKDSRAFQVYFPPSYFAYPSSKYPVLYILDGDYNFHYISGLVELMSGIGEVIPEMIVVAVSDGGSQNYARQCNPTLGEKPGDGDLLISFFEKELKPKIESTYRCSGFDILQGHSRGGLFITYIALERPDLFDAYSAISPALWWQEYIMLKYAEEKFAGASAFPAKLHMTLGSEKEMGVNRFVKLVETKFPNDPNFKFAPFPDQHHNVVGLPSTRAALLSIFEGYEVSRAQFKEFESPVSFVDHYAQLKEKFDYEMPLPWGFFGNVVYYYFSRDKMEDLAMLEKAIATQLPMTESLLYSNIGGLYSGKENFAMAEKYFQKCETSNPLAYQCRLSKGKMYLAQDKKELANIEFTAALQLAKQTKVRQWAVNEISSWIKE